MPLFPMKLGSFGGSIFMWIFSGSPVSRASGDGNNSSPRKLLFGFGQIRLCLNPQGRNEVEVRHCPRERSFSFDFVLKGKRQPDSKRNGQRLFPLLWEDGGRMGAGGGSSNPGELWSPTLGSGRREVHLRSEGACLPLVGLGALGGEFGGCTPHSSGGLWMKTRRVAWSSGWSCPWFLGAGNGSRRIPQWQVAVWRASGPRPGSRWGSSQSLQGSMAPMSAEGRQSWLGQWGWDFTQRVGPGVLQVQTSVGGSLLGPDASPS